MNRFLYLFTQTFILTALILITIIPIYNKASAAAPFNDCTCNSARTGFTCPAQNGQPAPSVSCPSNTPQCVVIPKPFDGEYHVSQAYDLNNNKYYGITCTTQADVPRDQLSSLNCSCVGGGYRQGDTRTNFDGQNGISCTYPDTATLQRELSTDNFNRYKSWAGRSVATMFCAYDNQACVQDPSKTMVARNGAGSTIKVIGSGVDGGAFDAIALDRTLKGVACENADQRRANKKVNCRCVTPGKDGAGNNGFICDGQSAAGEGNAKIYCGSSQDACIDKADASFVMRDRGTTSLKLEEWQDKNFFKNNYEGATAVGVSCEFPEEDTPFPTQPPPPSPPCADGSWVNGRCTNFVTAVGELGTDAISFTTRLFAILLSFSGGIALLLIIRSGYNMITSRGNPQKVQDARDQFTAAIVGLVFLIFSFVLLQVIGYDILRIPGFGGRSGLNGQGEICSVDSACQYGTRCLPTAGSPNVKTCQSTNVQGSICSVDTSCPSGTRCLPTAGSPNVKTCQ